MYIKPKGEQICMEKNRTIIEGQSELSSRIGLYRPKFNGTQQKIADFLLADEQAVLDMSIYDMAERSGPAWRL